MGNILVAVALIGWIPTVLVMFAAMPPRRAVIASLLGAWLFLPMAGYKLAEGIPVYDKMSATCVGVALGAFLFDTRQLWRYRVHWIDIPMIIWCLCPIASSISNELGLYNGLSTTFRQAVTWGLPYLIGRLYFGDQDGLRELAIGIFIGGLVYVPLCLIEIRMSPQLHTWVYGYFQHSFAQTYKFGGWRPTVFMQHGLMVGMWMCMTALVGVWLWYSRALPRSLWRIPTGWTIVALVVTAVWCKSAGAIGLLALGLVGLFAVPVLRTKWVIWALVIVGPLYMTVRAGDVWDGMSLVAWTKEWLGANSVESVNTRIVNENQLSAHALERPVFGWGGWGRNLVRDESGGTSSVTDGMWVIALGVHGLVGLVSFYSVLLIPSTLCFRMIRPGKWASPESGSVIVLATVLPLYALDCIPNAMTNPVFIVVSGGLATFAAYWLQAVPAAGGAPARTHLRRTTVA